MAPEYKIPPLLLASQEAQQLAEYELPKPPQRFDNPLARITRGTDFGWVFDGKHGSIMSSYDSKQRPVQPPQEHATSQHTAGASGSWEDHDQDMARRTAIMQANSPKKLTFFQAGASIVPDVYSKVKEVGGNIPGPHLAVNGFDAVLEGGQGLFGSDGKESEHYRNMVFALVGMVGGNIGKNVTKEMLEAAARAGTDDALTAAAKISNVSNDAQVAGAGAKVAAQTDEVAAFRLKNALELDLRVCVSQLHKELDGGGYDKLYQNIVGKQAYVKSALKVEKIKGAIGDAIWQMEQTLKAAKQGDAAAVAKVEEDLRKGVLYYTQSAGGDALRIDSKLFVSRALGDRHGINVYSRTDWEAGGSSPIWHAIDALNDCNVDNQTRAVIVEQALERFEGLHGKPGLEKEVVEFFKARLGDHASSYFRNHR